MRCADAGVDRIEGIAIDCGRVSCLYIIFLSKTSTSAMIISNAFHT